MQVPKQVEPDAVDAGDVIGGARHVRDLVQVTKNSGLIAHQGVSRASYDSPPASANPVGLERSA